jgi:DNA adenine methylase
MAVTTLAPWFGSNRMLASEVGKLLRGCEWVGIPFAGGMSEVLHIDARTIVVNDRHRHIINLARVAASRGETLALDLEQRFFHPDELAAAQRQCRYWESQMEESPGDHLEGGHYDAAVAYAIAVWMGRSAKAGTVDEFKGNLALRWNAGGGDSNVRYRSGIEAIRAFGEAGRRCTFSTLDFRDFLAKCKDAPKHGIYSDSPFPDAGDEYRHSFAEKDFCDLAKLLAQYEQTRVVVRYYDHPLIRELYPESRWTWHLLKGRTQANKEAPEVIITNGK